MPVVVIFSILKYLYKRNIHFLLDIPNIETTDYCDNALLKLKSVLLKNVPFDLMIGDEAGRKISDLNIVLNNSKASYFYNWLFMKNINRYLAEYTNVRFW